MQGSDRNTAKLLVDPWSHNWQLSLHSHFVRPPIQCSKMRLGEDICTQLKQESRILSVKHASFSSFSVIPDM